MVAPPAPSPPASSRGRVPWLRYAWAALLGLSILAMTYVLFDPDLGTEVPLFGEFTCRGRLDVVVGTPQDEAKLLAPQMALKIRTLAPDGEPLFSYVSVFRREAPEDWDLYVAHSMVSDPDLLFLELITNETQVRVEARDLGGRVCAAESPVISTSGIVG